MAVDGSARPEFERAFADYGSAPHARVADSGTAALHLALLASGIRPGDEVITTPLTFCATANVVLHAGATPRFADIDPITWNLSPAATSAAVTARTRADPRALRRPARRRGGVCRAQARRAA
ncbi:MAG: DegT/DnrJ/EryC1/StrS family aminotransferase [Vicinamibacterales bacterium]